MNNIHIATKPETHIRKFDGFLGPLWGIVLYVVESRRVVKEYDAYAKAVNAESKADAAEFERTAKIAEFKASEIRKNCAANVHCVDKWKPGETWACTDRYTLEKEAEWTNMHGVCKYCNSPVTKNAFKFDNRKI